MAFCTECGVELRQGAKFCHACGETVHGAAPMNLAKEAKPFPLKTREPILPEVKTKAPAIAAPRPFTPPRAKFPKRRGALIALAIFVLLVIGIIVGVHNFSDTLDTKFESFSNLIKK